MSDAQFGMDVATLKKLDGIAHKLESSQQQQESDRLLNSARLNGGAGDEDETKGVTTAGDGAPTNKTKVSFGFTLSINYDEIDQKTFEGTLKAALQAKFPSSPIHVGDIYIKPGSVVVRFAVYGPVDETRKKWAPFIGEGGTRLMKDQISDLVVLSARSRGRGEQGGWVRLSPQVHSPFGAGRSSEAAALKGLLARGNEKLKEELLHALGGKNLDLVEAEARAVARHEELKSAVSGVKDGVDDIRRMVIKRDRAFFTVNAEKR
jgi:hypothetical protein